MPKKKTNVEDPKVVPTEPKVVPTEPKVEPKVETVEIKKTDYEQLMARLEKNAKDIDLLYKAADKSRMAKARNDNAEVLIKSAKVWTWKDTGKIVISTKLIKNICEIVAGRWVEDQLVDVVLEDGEIVKNVPYLEFSRSILNKTSADILSREESFDSNKNKVILFKLQLPNGKELKINSSFVN
jgi:hypothetical protein